jgi:transcriptional regulator with XRE-family HTH domain
MVQRLGVEIPYTNISKYELNKNEPPLMVLLAYARAANVSVEALIDDQITVLNSLENNYK